MGNDGEENEGLAEKLEKVRAIPQFLLRTPGELGTQIESCLESLGCIWSKLKKETKKN